MFSTLRASSGYWKTEIDERDRDKTAFTSNHGLYRFTRIPFGLKNPLETFQRAIVVIISSVCSQFGPVHFDEIVVLSKSPADHIEKVWCVLGLLYEASVTLKLKKYKFFAERIDYLGFVIRPGRFELAERTTDGV